jgi:hypothetical protein
MDGKIQVAAGGTLLTLPIWVTTLGELAAVVASVCGAILGIAGVYRLIRNRKKKP